MRSTNQKQILKDHLCNRKDHPCAKTIAQDLAPKMGVATVYRNLKKMVANNQLCVITTVDNVAHYDVNQDNHCHLVCERCSAIIDVANDLIFKEQIETINQFKINLSGVILKGLCQNCQNNQ